MSARAVLRHRSFVALLTGRSVSLAGNGLANIAITFAVLDLTGSATDLGLVLAARSVPQVVLLLFGGVIADRLPRHLVLVVSNLVCGLTQTARRHAAADRPRHRRRAGRHRGGQRRVGAFIFPASAGLLPADRAGRRAAAGQRDLPDVLDRGHGRRHVARRCPGGRGRPRLGARRGRALLRWSPPPCFATIRLAPRRRLHVRTTSFTDLREGWSAFRVAHLALGRRARLQHSSTRCTRRLVHARPDHRRPRPSAGRAGASCSRPETAGMFVAGVVLLRVRFRRPLFVGMLGVLAWSPLMLVLAAEPAVLLLVVASFLAGVAHRAVRPRLGPPRCSSTCRRTCSARVYAYDALGSLVAIPVGQVLAGPLGRGGRRARSGGRSDRGGADGRRSPCRDGRSRRTPVGTHRPDRCRRGGTARHRVSRARSLRMEQPLPPQGSPRTSQGVRCADRGRSPEWDRGATATDLLSAVRSVISSGDPRCPQISANGTVAPASCSRGIRRLAIRRSI